MRQTVAWTLTLILLLLPLSSVLALEYTDADNLLTVSVPDNGSTVSYTEEEAYLPEDMQELADARGLDARLLVRQYTPADVLGYTLDIVTCPLSALRSAEPSATGRPARAERYTDITSSDVRENALAVVRSMYDGRFRLSAAQAGSFQGHPDLEITGTGRTDAHWTDYECSIYLLTNTERLVIITAVYLDSEKEAVDSILDTISLEGTAASASPADSPAPAASAPETVAPQAAAAETASADASASVTAKEGAAPQAAARMDGLQSVWAEHPELPYYLLLAAAVIVLAAGLVIYLRAARQRKRILEDEEDARPGLPAAGSRRQSRSANRHAHKEDRMGASDLPGRPEYDYTEDISRYTQQPSADVNDVSRYTHGYDSDDSLSDELRALQDTPLVTPKPAPAASVGSRVERNRRKKRK